MPLILFFEQQKHTQNISGRILMLFCRCTFTSQKWNKNIQVFEKWKRNLPVHERSLGVHKVELAIQAGPGLSYGGGVAQHAHSTLHLGQVTPGHSGGGLVVYTHLSVCSWVHVKIKIWSYCLVVVRYFVTMCDEG